LWCRQRASDQATVLEALAGPSPEHREIEQFVESLVQQGTIARVILDLSGLDLVTSSFMARLVTMNRLVRSQGGNFFLCGLRPHVREILERVHLHKAFDVVDSVEDAIEGS
jgi:anti-anti-sigma factor